MSTLFETTLSAHYHVAKLLGDADSHEKLSRLGVIPAEGRIDLTRWKKTIDNIGEAGPLLSRIPSREAAVASLAAHHKDEQVPPSPSVHSYTWLTNAKSTQLDLKQRLDSQHAVRFEAKPEYVSKVRHGHRRSRHATATWALYNWLYHKRHGKEDPYVGPHLEKTLGPDLHNRVIHDESVSDMNKAYTQYAKSVHPPIVRRAQDQGQDNDKEIDVPTGFKFNELTVDKNGVTRVQAQISHYDPSGTVDGAAMKTDPRTWMQNFPELWSSSYRLKLPPDVSDRFASPEPQDGAEIGKDWSGHFFERAQIGFDGVTVMGGSVLLYIDFKVTQDNPNKGKVTVAFSLYEALTTSVLCFQSPGGPDVDNGLDDEGEPLFSVQVGTENDKDDPGKINDAPGNITTTAGKHLRYSNDVHFSEELNAIALPLWAWAITGGLYDSVPTT